MQNITILNILNSAIITDLIVIILTLSGIIKSNSLSIWYKNYHILACIADILILVIGFILSKLIYYTIFTEYSLFYLILLTVFIQFVHDLLFAIFIYYFPKNKSNVIDLFKNYSNESGFYILLADALMIISTVILGNYFSLLSLNTNIIIIIFSIYLFPYFLGSF